MDTVGLYLSGTFQLVINGQEENRFRSETTRALLAYLALEGAAPVTRYHLARFFWPGYQHESAQVSLRMALSNLRQLLAVLPLLHTTHQGVRFQSHHPGFWCDVLALEEFVKHHGQAPSDPLATVIQRYDNELLAGFDLLDSPPFQQWLAHRRSQHRQLLEQARQWLPTAPDAPMEPRPAPVRRNGKAPPASVPTGPGSALLGQSAFAISPDWSEIPRPPRLYGRQREIQIISHWLLVERCRVAALLGMGGQGKTALAAQLVRLVAADPAERTATLLPSTVAPFTHFFWRSLVNAPPLAHLLQGWIQALSAYQVFTLPPTLEEQLSLLLHYLRQERTLLVLDNLESILQSQAQAGAYRPGYEDYGELLRRLGEGEHQSCLLFTSREAPHNLSRLADHNPAMRTWALAGLSTAASQELLQGRGLALSTDAGALLANHYSGNPLALTLVAETVQVALGGDVGPFLHEQALIFDDIRTVLDQQWVRLTPLEQELLTWLAIEREPVALDALLKNWVQPPTEHIYLDALRSLLRRLLVEPYADGRLGLQNVILEYVTDRLVTAVGDELAVTDKVRSETPATLSHLNRYALVKAQARAYVRESQTRLLLAPVAERWLAALGRPALEKHCQTLLEQLRRTTPLLPGYTAANLLHLLLQLEIDRHGYDFSQLAIWQANLQGVRLPGVNFAQAVFKDTLFTAPFTGIIALAFFPDSQHLAVGTHTGAIFLWRLADHHPSCLLSGHTDYTFIALSPDGKRLASASVDGSLRLWQLDDVAPTASVLVQQARPWRAVAFSPDGKTLVGGCDDGCIYLWDGISGGAQQVLYQQTTPVLALAFGGAEGQWLASAGHGDIYLWDWQQARLAATWRGHPTIIWSLAFSPDGKTLASGSVDQTVRLWELAEQTTVLKVKHCPPPSRVLTGHSAHIYSVAFSPDGKTLASGSFDQTVRLWEVASGCTQAVLGKHSSWVRAVAFSPDGKTLASGSNDQTIELWQLWTNADRTPGAASISGQLHTTLVGHASFARAVAFAPSSGGPPGAPPGAEGKILASGHADQLVRLWNVQSGVMERSLPGHAGLIYAVAFSPNGEQLASVGNDGQVRLWDLPTGRLTHVLPGYNGTLRAVAFSPDGKTLAVGGNRPWLQLWDIPSGELRHTLRAPLDQVWSVAFVPSGGSPLGAPPGAEGRLVATGTHTQGVLLWETSSGQLVRVLAEVQDAVLGIAFHPGGRLLAGGGVDGHVRLWEVESGCLVQTLCDGANWFFTVAFSPSGNLLAGGAAGGAVHVWSLAQDSPGTWLVQPRRCLEGHSIEVNSVAFSPDGRWLASAASDETIRLWAMESGECVHSLRAPGPYAGMNIRGISGVTHAQTLMLKALGAVD